MSSSRWLSLSILAFLTACPEPVSTDAPSAGGAGPGGANSAAGPQGGAPSANGMMGAPPTQTPTGENGPGAIPDADLDPQFSQDDLSDGNTISGLLVCAECDAPLLVRVLPPPPDQGGSDEGIILITAKSFDAPGEFALKVPKDRSKVVLQIVEDADGNGKPSAGERMGIPVDGPVSVDGDVAGVKLEVGVFPQMGAVDATGQQMTGGPEGAPNPTPPGAEQATAGGQTGATENPAEGPPIEGGAPPQGTPPTEGGPAPE